MKNFNLLNLGKVAAVALLCSSCANTESTAPQATTPSISKNVTKPTAKPQPSSTPSPTPTRAERRREARKKAKAERVARREKERAEARARAAAAYDVPALLGKTIEQVQTLLGPVEDSGPVDDDGEMSWSKSKGALLVHYDTSTRQTTSFFVNDQYGQPFTDRSRFLVMGNLRENDPRYTLEFVPLMGSTTEWMGVRIIPN